MATVPDSVKDRTAWLELEELDARGDGLTQWEIDFVESLRSQLLSGRRLSEKQQARLDEIREQRL